jgi:Uma2 family endonuclease
MTTPTRWTSADLERFPYDELTRYEIIDGELFVSSLGHVWHQMIVGELVMALETWNEASGIGSSVFSPGLIFNQYDDVVPDVVWLSKARLADGLDENGHLRVAPELIAEVLMPDDADQRRDREAKLLLYSRCGVIEYWIVNWMQRSIDVYRLDQAQLHYIATLYEGDRLESQLLPGFSCRVASLFERLID